MSNTTQEKAFFGLTRAPRENQDDITLLDIRFDRNEADWEEWGHWDDAVFWAGSFNDGTEDLMREIEEEPVTEEMITLELPLPPPRK